MGLVVTVYRLVMYTVCIVILVSMVTARDILEHGDDDDDRPLTRTSNTDDRIGGVHSTLGYVAPLLRLLSYLVGSMV